MIAPWIYEMLRRKKLKTCMSGTRNRRYPTSNSQVFIIRVAASIKTWLRGENAPIPTCGLPTSLLSILRVTFRILFACLDQCSTICVSMSVVYGSYDLEANDCGIKVFKT